MEKVILSSIPESRYVLNDVLEENRSYTESDFQPNANLLVFSTQE